MADIEFNGPVTITNYKNFVGTQHIHYGKEKESASESDNLGLKSAEEVPFVDIPKATEPTSAPLPVPSFFLLGDNASDRIFRAVDKELTTASSKSDACSRLLTLQNLDYISLTQFSDEEKASLINAYIADRQITNNHLGAFSEHDFRVSRSRKV